MEIVQVLDNETLLLIHGQQYLFYCRIAAEKMIIVERQLLCEAYVPGQKYAYGTVLCETLIYQSCSDAPLIALILPDFLRDPHNLTGQSEVWRTRADKRVRLGSLQACQVGKDKKGNMGKAEERESPKGTAVGLLSDIRAQLLHIPLSSEYLKADLPR